MEHVHPYLLIARKRLCSSAAVQQTNKKLSLLVSDSLFEDASDETPTSTIIIKESSDYNLRTNFPASGLRIYYNLLQWLQFLGQPVKHL
jgi:hypothetical protein